MWDGLAVASLRWEETLHAHICVCRSPSWRLPGGPLPQSVCPSFHQKMILHGCALPAAGAFAPLVRRAHREGQAPTELGAQGPAGTQQDGDSGGLSGDRLGWLALPAPLTDRHNWPGPRGANAQVSTLSKISQDQFRLRQSTTRWGLSTPDVYSCSVLEPGVQNQGLVFGLFLPLVSSSVLGHPPLSLCLVFTRYLLVGTPITLGCGHPYFQMRSHSEVLGVGLRSVVLGGHNSTDIHEIGWGPPPK